MARTDMTLATRISVQIDKQVDPAVAQFAAALAREAGALAVLFYGSNLRTGSLEGVLDFYVLLPGSQRERIWPRVSYHERDHGGITLRAKVATMSLKTFAEAASGELADTTIWARFVQPAALVFVRDHEAREQVIDALGAAAQTAARFAAALGPAEGREEAFWRALFAQTYKAEFRVEKAGREDSILALNPDHFEGLLSSAWDAGGISYRENDDEAALSPDMPESWHRQVLADWSRKRRLGKPLNFARLLKASTTFEGAAKYAAWKIERHTGMKVEVTPFRERHPILSAPGVLWALRKHRKQRDRG